MGRWVVGVGTAAVLLPLAGCSGASRNAGADAATQEASHGTMSSSASSHSSTARDGAAPIGDAGRDARADAAREAGVDAQEPRDATMPPPPDAVVGDANGASLLSLVVTSATNSALTLIPAFSPGTFDYYVQCNGHLGAAFQNMLTVSVTAPAAATVAISVETPGGALAPHGTSASPQTIPLTVLNDEAIVVGATVGATTDEYWVRCIPDDFPEMQWTTHAGGAPRPPGYYLWGTMSLPGGPRGVLAQEAAYAIVLDSNGVPVWYKFDNTYAAYDVETLIPGAVSFAGPWQVDELGGSVTHPEADAVDGGAPETPDEHELRILPNGHYLGLSSATEYVDLTGLSIPEADGTLESFGPDTPILGCYVQEFDATGTVFWQWSATQHFDPVTAMVVKGDGDLAGKGYVEPFHCNAIDVDPTTGDIIVSARHMSSVFYIEKSTGRVLWMMGGAAASSLDDATYVPVDDPFTTQHDARLQPGWNETCGGGSGQISVFDDESYTTNPARGVLYDVNIAGSCGDGGASTTGTTGATLTWQYKNAWNGGTPSNVCGSFRISSDGSRILGWGQSDPTPNGLVFTEVDDEDHDILDLICPDKSSSYRAVKVPLSAFDLGLLRTTAGAN